MNPGSIVAWPLVAALGLGALAFGGVYEWAYRPLLVVCVAIGASGFVRPRHRRSGRTVRVLVVPMGLVLAVMLLQVIPLDQATIARLSPEAHALLKDTNIAYFTDGMRHPMSLNPQKTWLSIVLVAGFSVFLLGLIRLLDGEAIRTAVLGLSGVGVVLSIVGVVQNATWNGKLFGFWEPLNTAGVAAFGPFINRNHFAGWMLLVLPLCLGYVIGEVSRGAGSGLRSRLLWLATPSGNRTLFVAFSTVVMATTIALTGSRSGVAGLAVCITTLALVLVKAQKRERRSLMLVAYLLVTLCVSLSWAGLEFISGRFAAAGPSLDGRVFVWRDAWRIHTLFPWFGTGINGYGTALVVHQQFMPSDFHYAQAHNDYLQILAEGGWLFAVPVLALIGTAAIEIHRRFAEGRDSERGYWLRVGAVTAILSIAVQEVAEFSLQMPAVFALFCVVSAIALRPSNSPA